MKSRLQWSKPKTPKGSFRSSISFLLYLSSMWFWFADASTATPTSTGFRWPRDSIYGAVILLGAGGAFVNVLAMTNIAYVIGQNVVSRIFRREH